MTAVTPDEITPAIRRFCRRLNATTEPGFITIEPQSGCEPGQCHVNVRGLVARQGGHGETGWALWNFNGLWNEAEFHEIWVTPEGLRVDVTPDPDGEVRRLFHPDPSRRFEGRCIPKRYDPLRSGGEVMQAMHLYSEANRIRCQYKPGLPFTPADTRRVPTNERQASLLIGTALGVISPPPPRH